MSAAAEPVADPGAAGRRVVLLRHGRTEWNATHRWQGHLDPPLDDMGRQQASTAAAALVGLRPAVLLSSDLHRARSTAEIVAAVAGLPVGVDPALRETDIGDWQGRTSAEISTRWAAELGLWSTGDVRVRPPGGENRLEVAARMLGAIRGGLAGTPKDSTLLVVSHGGAARVAIAALLELEHRSWGTVGGLGNCSWSVLGERAGQPDQPARWRLLRHNVSALDGSAGSSSDDAPGEPQTPGADETGGP